VASVFGSLRLWKLLSIGRLAILLRTFRRRTSAFSTRSVLVKGFPFSIVYRATDTELLVVAVSPHRKRPGYWQPRLGDG
jgi:hypothetical protein